MHMTLSTPPAGSVKRNDAGCMETIDYFVFNSEPPCKMV